MSEQLDRLLSIMARLRGPSGCEWDRAQTFRTIAPYTIEEAYEVADAIARGDMDDMRDELGDLLLQVVFHARMAEEAGHFDFADVAKSFPTRWKRAIRTSLPTQGAGEARDERWEALKAAERTHRGTQGALDGVARALPALLRAEKLQKRGPRDRASIGRTRAVRPKRSSRKSANSPKHRSRSALEEAGDLLFAAVNLVRAYGIGAEDALSAANLKFERRFRAMEALAGGHEAFAALSLDEQEALWQRAKADEA